MECDSCGATLDGQPHYWECSQCGRNYCQSCGSEKCTCGNPANSFAQRSC
ncbi:MAG: hypothetical protein OXK17_08315 [Thaumarchaeota archaeon]|nr:hypothetical protein [Nitrososphaerota archaeon]